MAAPSEQGDPLGRLADALAEDILATPGAELLAESAEDYGNGEELSAEFDRFFRALEERFEARNRVPSGTSPAQFAGRSRVWHPWEWLAVLRQQHLPVGRGRLPRGLRLAVASLLVFVGVAGLAALHWSHRTPTSSPDEFANAASPATTVLLGDRLLQAPAAQYVVQLSWQRNQEDAVADLLSRPGLEAKFPSLPAGEVATIRQAGRDGRLSLAGFTAEQGRDFCEQFKATGGECSVREPSR